MYKMSQDILSNIIWSYRVCSLYLNKCICAINIKGIFNNYYCQVKSLIRSNLKEEDFYISIKIVEFILPISEERGVHWKISILF